MRGYILAENLLWCLKEQYMNLTLWTDLDERLAASLRDRLPFRVFDAHAHPYQLASAHPPADHPFADGPAERSVNDWCADLGRLVGIQRVHGGLFVPMPFPDSDRAACNAYVRTQAAGRTGARCLALFDPQRPRKETEADLDHPCVCGFKPYHFFSGLKDSFAAPMKSFAPEWMWRLAHERGLVVLLHLVRDRALADEDNLLCIRETMTRFPNVKLILAHAARGFNAWHTAEALPRLADLDNIWFDTSAVCEARAFLAILDTFGPRKLLWGTDYPVSQMHDRAVSVGDGFLWPATVIDDWAEVTPRVEPTTVGVESLRALLDAADAFGLNDADMQDVFADNAMRLLGLLRDKRDYGQELYARGRMRIPGGTQLLSKRPEMFAPGLWPPYSTEARGCEVRDLNGRRYRDFSIFGVGSCLLGFRDPDVTRAVKRRVNLGTMSSLNPPDEVELADLLCRMHPWAEKVRFARTGGESMAAAVRIARATTGRSLVAICGYHGWHDWYLAANLGADDTLRGHLLPGLEAFGVPAELRGTTLAFHYNDLEEFNAIMDAHGERLAVVVTEPCRNDPPQPGFMETLRERTRRARAVWIIDEISMGLRLARGGAHLRFGAQPDMAVFSKALGNGHPIGAIIGTAEAMEGAHCSFISSTYWTESVGPAAALATLRKMHRLDIPAYVARQGKIIVGHWQRIAKAHGLPIKTGGFFAAPHFAFDHAEAQTLRTLFTQWMLDRGYLAGPMVFVSLAHTDALVAQYAEAVDEVFGLIARAIKEDNIASCLRGPIAHTGFSRLT